MSISFEEQIGWIAVTFWFRLALKSRRKTLRPNSSELEQFSSAWTASTQHVSRISVIQSDSCPAPISRLILQGPSSWPKCESCQLSYPNIFKFIKPSHTPLFQTFFLFFFFGRYFFSYKKYLDIIGGKVNQFFLAWGRPVAFLYKFGDFS